MDSAQLISEAGSNDWISCYRGGQILK